MSYPLASRQFIVHLDSSPIIYIWEYNHHYTLGAMTYDCEWGGVEEFVDNYFPIRETYYGGKLGGSSILDTLVAIIPKLSPNVRGMEIITLAHDVSMRTIIDPLDKWSFEPWGYIWCLLYPNI
jgi:hypothetical protein